MTLPLKLVAFERYMLTDDRPTHPMVCPVRLVFSGRLDREALVAAVQRAVERHPLLGARIEGHGRGMRWVAAPPGRTVPIEFIEADPMRYPGRKRIELLGEPGVRVWVAEREDRVEMRIDVHHACCDGVGVYRFLEDLLCLYHAAARGEQHPELPPCDPTLLPRRARFGLGPLGLLLRVPQEAWGLLVGTPYFLLTKPAPLAAPEPAPDEPAADREVDPLPAHQFTADELSRLRAAARVRNATLNDLMIRDVLLAVQQWNARHDEKLGRRMVRLMIPYNLRGPDDGPLPAANVVGMSNIDRHPHRHKNLDRMLTGIRLETRFQKVTRIAIAFVRGCGLASMIPGGLKFLTMAHRCFGTAVLSNLGRVFFDLPLPRDEGRLLVGDLRLEEVASAPPVRPYTRAAFSLLTYAGTFTLAMNYDPYVFTPQSAGELLATAVERLRQTAAEEAPREEATEEVAG